MFKLKINFYSLDSNILLDIFGEREVYTSFGTKSKISDNIEVQLGQIRIYEAITPQPYEIIIYIYEKIIQPTAVGILSAWLYDILKNKTNEITIEDTTIELEQEKIQETLIEKTEIKEN